MQNKKFALTEEQVKASEKDCEKAINLIYDLIDQKGIAPNVMAQACIFCFQSLSLALNIPHKKYAKVLDFAKNKYEKALKEFNKEQ